MTEPKFKHAFFIPYVGKHYDKGISGKKILVVGASFYCLPDDAKKRGCKVHDKCTSLEKKDSWPFSLQCYNNGEDLRNEPRRAIEDYEPISYQNFRIFLEAATHKENPWEYVAFTNYVQFMQPCKSTDYGFLTNRDFEALEEVVKTLDPTPDIIITWGDPVKKHIWEKCPGVHDELNKTEKYISHPTIGGKRLTMVNIYHPSATFHWCGALNKAYHYMKMALEE